MIQILFVDSDPKIYELIQGIDWTAHQIRGCFWADSVEKGR